MIKLTCLRSEQLLFAVFLILPSAGPQSCLLLTWPHQGGPFIPNSNSTRHACSQQFNLSMPGQVQWEDDQSIHGEACWKSGPAIVPLVVETLGGWKELRRSRSRSWDLVLDQSTLLLPGITNIPLVMLLRKRLSWRPGSLPPWIWST